MNLPPVAERARTSPWVGEIDGLADAVVAWERDLRGVRADPEAEVARWARPGPVGPVRIVRYAAALRLAGAAWQLEAVRGALADGGRPWDRPGWVPRAVARVLRDHLAMLGPAGAEIARIVEQSDGLVPSALVDEIRRRPVSCRPVTPPVASRIVTTAFGSSVRRLSPEPLVSSPVSQLHSAELGDGTPVLVRVRRPGIHRRALTDTRATATLALAAERVAPAAREAHPLGFVELAARQLVEEVDLRHDALNAVELGTAVESCGLAGISVARPVPGLVHRHALVTERPDGTPLSPAADAPEAVPAMVALAARLGLEAGVFPCDLALQHLWVRDDGGICVVGCTSTGRLDAGLRRAALRYLTAVLSGDHEGQVEAMRAAGALPDGVDAKALLAALTATESLDPVRMLTGGEGGVVAGLGDAVTVLLRHGLRPPLDAVLLVRNVFVLRRLVGEIAPGVGLLAALMPLVQQLPAMAADLP